MRRRTPRQARGQRRVAAFLRAAETLFLEAGYERATMSAVAERTESSIGSLYQFFPNKQALADAVRAQYLEPLGRSWLALAAQAARLGTGDLAVSLVDLQIDILRRYPVLLALIDAAPTPKNTARRRFIGLKIASVVRAHRPRMAKVTALRIGLIVQRISRALLTLYAQARADEKTALIDELKTVLKCYLVARLGPASPRPRARGAASWQRGTPRDRSAKDRR